jgi:hypothetical protein
MLAGDGDGGGSGGGAGDGGDGGDRAGSGDRGRGAGRGRGLAAEWCCAALFSTFAVLFTVDNIRDCQAGTEAKERRRRERKGRGLDAEVAGSEEWK